jgi:hypothetical protein
VVTPAAELLLGTRGQRKLLAFMEGDDQDTGAKRLRRSGCVGF